MATPGFVARFGRYAMQHRIGAVGACELWRVEATDPEDAHRCSVEVLIDRNDVDVVSEFVDGVTVRNIVEQARRCKSSVPV